VASRAIQDWAIGYVFSIMDKDGPDLHEYEEAEIGKFLEREQEREDVIGNALEPPIDGVECDGGVRCGHDPFVVGFVKGLVDQWMVKATVNKVNEHIREENEERELYPVVVFEGLIAEGIVELGISVYFGEEEWEGEKRHARHRE